jgi:hypothetical protein
MIFHKPYIKAFITAISALLFACGEEPPSISGRITGLPDGEVYLNVWEGQLRTIDSVQTSAGLFTMPLPEIIPDVLYLRFAAFPDLYLPLIADGHNIFVSGNANYHDAIRVFGSEANNDLYEYRKSVRDYGIKLKTLELELSDYADSTAVTDSLALRTLQTKRDSIRRLIADSQNDFIRAKPGSIVAAMFAENALPDSASAKSVDSVLAIFDNTMPDNAFIRRLHRRRGQSQGNQ